MFDGHPFAYVGLFKALSIDFELKWSKSFDLAS